MNEFFARLLGQSQAFWEKLDQRQRVITASAAVLTVLSIGLVVYFSNQTTYVLLFESNDLQSVARVKATLDESGYVHQLEGNGRRVLVPANKRDEITLVLAGEGLTGDASIRGWELFDQFDIGITDFQERLRALRASTGEMRRIIRRYDVVEDVQISVPFVEKRLFTSDQEEKTASAVLTLKMGTQLTDEQIRAIRNVIAYGFEGLRPENVMLTDQYANILEPEEGGSGRVTTTQFEIERDTERGLEREIRKVLGGILGYDKIHVSVNADFEWDAVSIQRTEYTSPGFDQLKQSEQTRNEHFEGEGIRPGGEPGVTSNLPNYVGTYQRGPLIYDNQEALVNYLANSTLTERIQSPFIKRLTASVSVDGGWELGEDTGVGAVVRTYVARTDEEMQRYRNLVAGILGENPERQDMIVVENVQFDRSAEFAAIDKAREEEIRQKRMIYMALFVAVVSILSVLFFKEVARRRMLKEEELARQRELERQRSLAAAEAGLVGELTLEEQERAEISRRASSIARAKPAMVADLIRTWLAEED